MGQWCTENLWEKNDDYYLTVKLLGPLPLPTEVSMLRG